MNDPTFDPAAKRALDLFNKLWNDEKLGPQIREAAAREAPDSPLAIAMSNIDSAVKPLKEKLEAMEVENKKLREEREAEVKTRQEEAGKLDFEQKFASAKAKFHLTDEGVDKVAERMKATGNFADVEAAAAWVVSQTPPPPKPGPTWAPQSMNLFGSKNGDERFAALHKDPIGYMDAELQEFVADPDKYMKETLGS